MQISSCHYRKGYYVSELNEQYLTDIPFTKIREYVFLDVSLAHKTSLNNTTLFQKAVTAEENRYMFFKIFL